MQHLLPYGWSARVAALAADHPDQVSRVVAVHRDRVMIVTPGGTAAAWGLPLPAVGDWVTVEPTPDQPISFRVVTVLDRWSSLQRVDPVSGGQDVDVVQILAANVDQVFLTHPLDRPVSLGRIERELVAAWDSGASPVVVLTKADATSGLDSAVAEVTERVAGADVVVTSSVTGAGLESLAARARPDRTVVFLGASGAGKTSLVNALTGLSEAVGAVRREDNRGRHTTTIRHLVPLPGGGVLIDTPGIRNLGLWASEEGIDQAFPEVAELAAQCRFRDCVHHGEPGCAVEAALASGRLAADRFASWRKLEREIAAAERRQDPAAAREFHRQWRTAAKARRNDPHYRRKK